MNKEFLFDLLSTGSVSGNEAQIEKKIYDINEINTALYEYGEQLLGNRAS